MPSVNPGQSLGPYRIEAEIGAGGMGVVYRALDPRLGRAVALKLLPHTTDPERLARFEREARILAALHHPNIAGIHSFEEADGARFITMELAAGEPLADRLARGPLPLAEALDVCRQIALALEAAHEAGVVHRDLKPGNVLVAPDGQVKVLDFGLARIDEANASDSGMSVHTVAATRAGVILGTAAYMSPEQARGRPLDRRTDIWSFGCVLYECLTGRQAFAGETISDSIAKILEREPDMGAIPPSTPEPVVTLVARCLEKDPKERLRDIGEARVTLEKVLARRSPSGAIPLAPPRRRALAWPLVALPFLALGAVLGVLFAPKRSVPLTSVAVSMPSGERVRGATLLADGRTITALSTPPAGDDGAPPPVRLSARALGTYEWRPLAATAGLLNSWTAPDGRRILMLQPVTAGMAQKRLLTLPVDGSAPPTPFADWNDAWIALTWLANGDAIVLDTPMSFIRLPKDGGAASAPTKITVEGKERVTSIELPPVTHPDPAKMFVNIVAYDARGWHYAVGELDLKSGRVRRVVDDGGNAWYHDGTLYFARGRTIFAAPFDGTIKRAPIAAWSGLRTNLEARPGFFRIANDGSLFYAPGGTGEGRALAIADSGGVRERLPFDTRNYDDAPQVARDGRTFAATVANGRGIDELWTGVIGEHDLKRLHAEAEADCSQPTWSPDMSNVAFRRTGRNADDGLYVVPAGGGEARCVLRVGVTDTTWRPCGWFEGGRSLLVWRNAGGKDDLFRLAIDGDASDRSRLVPFAPPGTNRRFARLSPEGTAVVYLGDETGQFECTAAPVGADGTMGTPVTLTSGGSNAAVWTPDGHTIVLNDVRNRVISYPWPARPGVAGRLGLDLDRLEIAVGAPLGGGKFLVRLRGGDEAALTSYQLVLGFAQEVKRRLR